MNINEVKEARHEILDALNTEFNEAMIAAVLTEEQDGEPEMIQAVLDEMGDPDDEPVGQFLFRPLQSEEDTVQYFVSIITLWDELPEDRLGQLYEALAYINFSLPTGCFSIDKDHRFLCFVLSLPLPMDLPKDEVFRQVDLSIGNAIGVADMYMGIISDVMTGKEDASGVIEFLGGPAK